MQFSIFQHLRAIATSVRGGSSSVSMSGQGYASSALARYLIEYLIDTFLGDPRQTLVQALGNLEGENPKSPVVIED
ncbi:hypothetical protein EDD85DRAFT_961336 [Armillaria nabsnona]|nr:hypothetical protein EDD85DRAFT_961336 [Armillaria nabsnona]